MNESRMHKSYQASCQVPWGPSRRSFHPGRASWVPGVAAWGCCSTRCIVPRRGRMEFCGEPRCNRRRSQLRAPQTGTHISSPIDPYRTAINQNTNKQTNNQTIIVVSKQRLIWDNSVLEKYIYFKLGLIK